MLILEVYETWDDEVDMEADNRSDASKRAFMADFTDLEKANKYRLHGYASLKMNNDDATIKYGNFTVNLFKPPINTRKRYLKDMFPDEQIKLTLQMPMEKNLDDLEEERRALAAKLKEEAKAKAILSDAPYIESRGTKLNPKDFYNFG